MKTSEAATRAAQTIADGGFGQGDLEVMIEIIDEAFAPAIKTLTNIAKYLDKDNPYRDSNDTGAINCGEQARRALKQLGVPLEETSDE